MNTKLITVIIVVFIIGVIAGVFGYLTFISRQSITLDTTRTTKTSETDGVYRNEKYGFEMKLTKTPTFYMVPAETISFLEKTIYDFLMVKLTFNPEPVIVLSRPAEDINTFYFYNPDKNTFTVSRGADGPKIGERTIPEFLQEYSSASLLKTSDGISILKIAWEGERYMSALGPGNPPYCIAGYDYHVLRPVNIKEWFTNYQSMPYFYRFSLSYCSLKRPWLEEFTAEDRSIFDKVSRQNTDTQAFENILTTLKFLR